MGIVVACFVVFLCGVKLGDGHFKTGCLLMSATVPVGLAAPVVLVLFLQMAPIYIAREESGQVRVTRNVVVGSPIYVLNSGARQKLSMRWEGSLFVNDTSRQLRIQKVLYSRHWTPPGLVANEPAVVGPCTVMPLSHRLHHFGQDDKPPDDVRVEKGQQADARYQVVW